MLGLGVSLFTIFLAIADEKFNINCSYTTKEATYTKLWNPGGGMAPYYVSDRESVEWCEPLVFALVPFFPLLLLSLITYRMKDEVFHAWWSFTRWWVVVIIVVTILLENEGGGGGFGGGLAMFFIGSFYIILILGSISKILHTHLTLKYKEQGKSTTGIDKAKNIINVILFGSIGTFFLWLFI